MNRKTYIVLRTLLGLILAASIIELLFIAGAWIFTQTYSAPEYEGAIEFSSLMILGFAVAGVFVGAGGLIFWATEEWNKRG